MQVAPFKQGLLSQAGIAILTIMNTKMYENQMYETNISVCGFSTVFGPWRHLNNAF